MTVNAIGDYKNNADLMVACRELGYLSDDMLIWDPTYGLGRFWTQWKPELLMWTDLDASKSPYNNKSTDLLEVWWGCRFDAIVLDPPYKLNGTPSQGGPASSDESYGVHEPRTWQERHQLIRDMIDAAHRNLRDGGTLLLKCQNQVCSGQVRWQTIEFTNHAATLGLRLVDELMLVGARPQPSGRRQVHARRNYSSLLVFK